MNTVELKCTHCGEHYAYPKYELSAHLGKKAKIKCKHCNERNLVIIDLPLLKGEQESYTNIHQQESKDRTLSVTKLLVQESIHNKSFELELPMGLSIIGRESNAESSDKISIPTSDKTISRIHCQIEKVIEEDTVCYVIKDLASTNGTYINGDRITDEEEVYLMPGDTVKLGNIEIKVS